MFNKYAELRKIALLYKACRGLLRIKLAADTFSPAYQKALTVNDVMRMNQNQLEDLYTQNNSSLRPEVQAYMKQWGAKQQGGTPNPAAPTATAPAGGTGRGEYKFNADYFTPEQQQALKARGIAYSNVNPEQAKRIANGESVESIFGAKPSTAPANPAPANPANPAPANPQPQQQRRPTSPLQQRQMSRQQYMQNHQQQIQQAGQQAQQNATKGFFGRAMNWLTGGGYGGWANGRAQAKQQRQLNQRYDQQGAQLRANQQKARQRMQGAQIQKFLMSRQPQQPANPVQTPKAAGYNLLSLFPGYRQLFNYV